MRMLVGLVFLAGVLGAASPANESRLLGTWDCEGSAPGFTSTQVYAPIAGGGFSLTNNVRASSGKTGKVGETFRFDPAAGVWTVAAAPNAFFGGLQLTGPPWTGSTWTLSGTEIVLGRARPVRIVYTDLGTELFRREHQVRASGSWQDDAELVCRRRDVAALPSPSPSTPAPAATRTPSPMPTRTPSPVPTRTPTAAPLPTRTPTAAPLPSRTPTAAPLPSRTPTAAPLPPPTPSPTAAASASAAPSVARRTPAPAAVRSAAAVPARRATPRPSPSGTPPPRAAQDRAFSLVGTWNCRTITNATSTHAYALQGDGSLSLRNDLRIGNRDFEIDESYRFDPAHARWENETQHGAYRGSARRWSAQSWVFDGIDTEDGSRIPVRMTYTSLGPNAFKRDFSKLRDGRWMPYASETCRRGTP